MANGNAIGNMANYYNQNYVPFLEDLTDPYGSFWGGQGSMLSNVLNQRNNLSAGGIKSAIRAATGMGQGSAGNIVDVLMGGERRKNYDFANQFQQTASNNALGFYGQGMGMLGNYDLGDRAQKLERERFEFEKDSSLWNSIINTGIGIGALALAPTTGGLSLGALGALGSGSSTSSPSSSNRNLGLSQMGANSPNMSMGGSSSFMPTYGNYWMQNYSGGGGNTNAPNYEQFAKQGRP